MIPTIGRIVLYTLTADDAEQIRRWRTTGVLIHIGGGVAENMEFPMMIVWVYGADPTSAVNGQVFLDGNDVFWTQSVCIGEGPGSWRWPPRI
jgi:hypothetical protein